MSSRVTFTCALCAIVLAGSGLAFSQAPTPSSASPNLNSPAVPIVPTPASTAPQPPAPVPLTPGEIYKQAMHPLDVVRTELNNWSDPELQALGVGVKMAHEACDKSKTEDYKGDDLFDLARLCALGQDWNKANTVAQAYIASGDKTHRAQAYAITVSALVHIRDIDTAVATAGEMLRSLPYDAEVAYSIRSLKDYLEQSGNPAARSLAEQEHPLIVDALKQSVPLKAGHGDAVMSIGGLYESGMKLAFFARYTGDETSAGATVAELDDALGTNAQFTGSDWLDISRVRTEYGLIGWRLPQIEIERSLATKAAKMPAPTRSARPQHAPALSQTASLEARVNGPDFGAATVLVLFPDWCAQCRAMMKTVTEFATLNAETFIRAYGLMYADDAPGTGETATEAIEKELEGTNTLIVPAETATRFAPNDFPLAVVVDHTGVVRFIGAIPTDSFNGNGYMERIIMRMATAEASQKFNETGN